jgi:hypothetical protein
MALSSTEIRIKTTQLCSNNSLLQMSKRAREVTTESSQFSEVKKSSRIAQQQVDIFLMDPQ